MPTLIVLEGTAFEFFDAPQYLKYCDHDAHDGRGEVAGTLDIKEAMRFPNLETAIEFWQKPSSVKPRREDGKTNRPLSAFTITFEQVPE